MMFKSGADPFSGLARDVGYTAHARPQTVAGGERDRALTTRPDPFRWAKPPEMDRATLSASAKFEIALTLEAEVKERDGVIRSLVKQLHRANEENYRLLVELSGFRGAAREKLYRENKVLRERLARVTRENLLIRGLSRREKSGIVGRGANG